MQKTKTGKKNVFNISLSYTNMNTSKICAHAMIRIQSDMAGSKAEETQHQNKIGKFVNIAITLNWDIVISFY
jgi:hypothetical protein